MDDDKQQLHSHAIYITCIITYCYFTYINTCYGNYNMKIQYIGGKINQIHVEEADGFISSA